MFYTALLFAPLDFPRDIRGQLLFNPSGAIELQDMRPYTDHGKGGWFGTGPGPLNYSYGDIKIEVDAFIQKDMVIFLKK